MTEPVAYLAKSRKSGAVNATVKQWSYHDFENIPLYTKEQLQPKVQMTHAEFDEFIILKRAHNYSIKRFLIVISNETNNFPLLRKRYLLGVEKQLELSALWVNYTLGNREETIEIVPDTKWFVRSKKRDDEGDYLFLSGSNLDDLDYLAFDYARAFDTQEEAEKWTNPLTKAVQLPVEE